MSRRRLAAAIVAAVLAAACATARRQGAGTLTVACNVPEATLRIDDVLVGRVREWATPRALGPGFHRVEIAHPSHFTFYAEISLRTGEGAAVRAELRPLLE